MSTSSSTTDSEPESIRQKEFEEKFERRKREAEEQQEAQHQEEKQSDNNSNSNKKQEPPAILKPTNILEDADKGLFFDKKKYPGYNNEEYNRVISTIRGERQKYITEVISKRDKHIIPLYANNGGPDNDPLLDPSKPFTAGDADHIKSIAIEQKEYDFHDASVKHFHIMQDLDNKYAQTVQDITYAIQNAPRGGISGEEFMRLSNNLRDAENKRYRYGARLFLRMTDDEYERAVNLQNVKDAVDGAAHRTAHTIPNYTKT